MGLAPLRGSRLETRVEVPGSVEKAYEWISDPRRLDSVTPSWFRVRPRDPFPVSVGPGTQFSYRMALGGVPVQWVSEIDHWDPPHRFSYVQLRGPYRWFWHDHWVWGTERGALITDVVEYALWGGRVAGAFGVRRALSEIFRVRAARLWESLGNVR